MAGIYIHIPFCKKKCTYCDFHFSTTFESYRKEMIFALCHEIEMRLSDKKPTNIKTIYFGGGTPSLLNAEDWSHLSSTLKQFCVIDDLLEFTIEANPDDITKENLMLWKVLGINRLSVGVQSFRQEDLVWMNRAHTADESLRCIELAQQFGFQNLTIDLMYGLPNQGIEIWEDQLHKVGELGVSHVSAYCLTVEERTALQKRVDLGDLIIPDDELVEQQFQTLIKVLKSYGLEQYEISNFAKPGHEAIHNSNYWLGEPYLGIGPSAHGFDGANRYWNIANNSAYIHALKEETLPQTMESLTPKDRFNELILTGLRTKWGVELSKLNALIPIDEEYQKMIDNFVESGVLVRSGDTLKLSQQARIKADYYSSELFQD